MVIREWLKELVETILKEGTRQGNSKSQIETIINKCRGMDKRTIQNWFNALWKLGYLIQSRSNLYFVDVTKACELEIVLPLSASLEEGTLTHTKTSEEEIYKE